MANYIHELRNYDRHCCCCLVHTQQYKHTWFAPIVEQKCFVPSSWANGGQWVLYEVGQFINSSVDAGQGEGHKEIRYG